MRFPVDDEVLEAAQKLGPLIRDHAEETERERRPARAVMEALANARLFRLMTPRSLGGLEVDPLTCGRVIEEVAGFDSAAGWALMTANSVDWLCARLPEKGPEEIYAESVDQILAAAFAPPLTALKVDGGYRLRGRRPLASNIHEANWLLVTALVSDGDEPTGGETGPEVIGAIARAREAEIIDTWHTLGMRGTDSNDVALADVFVPSWRTFPLVPGFEPGPHYRGPLYRLPAVAEAAWVVAPVPLGIARGAITELHHLAQSKLPFGSTTVLRERAVAQARVAQAEAVLRSARLLFYDTLGEAWDRACAGQPFSLEHRADVLLAGTHAVAAAVQAVDLMYGLAGTSAIYTRSPIERHFRDVQTLRHHGFTAESRYETVGQVYLGVDPEFGLMAL